jgi:glycosyltransferase involved in cell wall biosynthesis
MDTLVRILFLNSYQAVRGGAERVLFDTSVELVSRGHRVSIVVAHDDRRAPNSEFWPAEINRYYVPELMIPVTDRYSYDRSRRTSSYRQTIRYLQDIIDIEEPDIVHVHNFPRIEILNELRIATPLVRTIHSYENLCGNHLKLLPGGSVCAHPAGMACQTNCSIPKSFRATRVRAENRLMATRFGRLLAVSSFVRDELVRNGFDPERVQLLNNFTRIKPGPPGIAEENLVLHVGRPTAEKGLLQLIESISLTESKPKLLVVGKDAAAGAGRFQSDVLKTASHLGVTIEFQEWCGGAELRRAFRRATVVAFSSIWPEPFGLVGIEAMMHAKPVVAFDSGGVRDWLQDGRTGFAVPRMDVKRFAQCLDRLLHDDALRRSMGSAAQQSATERFTADAHINKLLDIYTEVVDEDITHRPVGRTEVRDPQCGISVSL